MPTQETQADDLSKREIVVQGLTDYALSEIERKYGIGEGDGINPKRYHNRVHTEMVLDAARRIAHLSLEAGKISDSEIPLIEIAAAFHDIEQDLGGGLNERESAAIAEEKIRKTGLFEEGDIQKVRRMILATTVFFEDGIMRQSATEEYLTKIIADADLSSLGQEPSVYWERAKNLLKEFKNTNTPSKEDEVVFTEGQPSFLENHQFYTEESNRLFPYKQENIEFTLKQIELLKS